MRTKYILEGWMKRIIVGMVMVLAALVTCWAEVVVVPPFQDRNSGMRSTDIENITDSLINAVYRTGRFEVPDRDEQARKLQLDENNFQISDWSDETKTIEMGKVLNADFIVRGVVSQYSDGRIYVMVRLLHGTTLKLLGAAERESANFREVRDQMSSIVKELLGDVKTVADAERDAARRSAEIARREAEWAAQERREAERAQAEAERVTKQERDAWKNKRWYIGPFIGGGVLNYFIEEWVSNGLGSGNYYTEWTEYTAGLFEIGSQVQLQVAKYFAIEADVTLDVLNLYPVLPIFAEFTLQPGITEINVGIGYTIGLGLSFEASVGIHAGPGIIFAEFIQITPWGSFLLDGYASVGAIGYKFGIRNRK
ncbi:hypothetical protein AGMMS49944_27220 [Spirochaetia bacterium]|nr:hypothetical protein AGMMS49944_27220 [Spirochaetia bacterium]